jgi:hypothetical protein
VLARFGVIDGFNEELEPPLALFPGQPGKDFFD